MRAEGGKGAFKNPQGPAAREQWSSYWCSLAHWAPGSLSTPTGSRSGSRTGRGRAGTGRKDQRKGRDVQGVVKLPLQQRSQPPCAWPAGFSPPADTLKAPTSQSQFEISTLAHQEAEGMGAFHPSELPVLRVGVGGPLPGARAHTWSLLTRGAG